MTLSRSYWWVIGLTALPAVVVGLTVGWRWWGFGLFALWNALRIFVIEPRRSRSK